MATVKTIVAAEVKVEGLDKAGQSVGSFKKQLKEALTDLHSISSEFGLTSKEAAAAAQKVALLRDHIGDAKQLADTFNPDKKFVALGGAVQGAIGGFTALTGVMGLFGAKSEQTEALLLKVQSAMALQQGLSGLKSSIDSFKLLGAAIKASTIYQKINNAATAGAAIIQKAFGSAVIGTGTAFNGLKAAIIGTGIGALVVGIGLLIDKLGFFSSATDDAAEKQERLNRAIDNANSVVDEHIDNINREGELEVKRAKIAGKSEEEITKIVKDNIQKRIEYRDGEGRKLFTTGEQQVEAYRQNNKDRQQLADIDLDYQLKNADKIRAAQEKADAERKAANEKRRKELQDLLAELARLQSENRNKEKAEVERYGQELKELDEAQAAAKIKGMYDQQEQVLETKQALAELALLDDPDSIDNKLLKNQADFDLEMLQFDGNAIQRQVKEKEHADAIIKIKEDEVEAKKAIDQKALDFQNYVIDSVANGLDTLANIAGKQTAAGKVLAIASTVIKTIQGGIAAFTGMVSSIPGPVGIALGVVAAAGVVAAGVKAVKQITAVQIPKGGSTGGAPSISLPSAPLTPQAQTTQLNQGSINAVGNAANRAFILETDVSTNQERIRRLNRAARIN